mmetsp:Transcript_3232/g.9553  ORF Transcript_3232/g.9553 Transcript_3232/m.9553 type:complete len:238 (+) Transcript_3232:1178-1891(+)
MGPRVSQCWHQPALPLCHHPRGHVVCHDDGQIPFVRELHQALRHLHQPPSPHPHVLEILPKVEGDRVDDDKFDAWMLANERRQDVDDRKLLCHVARTKEVDPLEDPVRVQFSRFCKKRVVFPPDSHLFQMSAERFRHLRAPLGCKTPLCVEVHGFPGEPVERRRHLHVNGQLHSYLRLPNARCPTELGDLTGADPTAKDPVERLAKRHQRLFPPLLVEHLFRRCNVLTLKHTNTVSG